MTAIDPQDHVYEGPAPSAQEIGAHLEAYVAGWDAAFASPAVTALSDALQRTLSALTDYTTFGQRQQAREAARAALANFRAEHPQT